MHNTILHIDGACKRKRTRAPLLNCRGEKAIFHPIIVGASYDSSCIERFWRGTPKHSLQQLFCTLLYFWPRKKWNHVVEAWWGVLTQYYNVSKKLRPWHEFGWGGGKITNWQPFFNHEASLSIYVSTCIQPCWFGWYSMLSWRVAHTLNVLLILF
jgi:hypothetical protein